MEFLILSETVTRTRDSLQSHSEVSTETVVKAILQTHSEYAGGRARKLELDESSSQSSQPVDGWLQQVRALYDPTHAPELHGKMVIIGLALLDAELRQQLQQNDFLTALIAEVKEQPFPNILSEEGRVRYRQAGLDTTEISSSVTSNIGGQDTISPPPQSQTSSALIPETTPPARRPPIENEPILKDNPLDEPAEDQLGRADFAEYLAARIADLSSTKHAFALHLHAPWGAGKSTLLNFLKKELKKQKGTQWVVIEFNAWQHQHIRPPWWSLLDRTFHGSKSELYFDHVIREYWWRFMLGRLPSVIALTVIAALFLMALPTLKTWVSGETLTKDMEQLADIAGYVTAIIATVATVWAILQNTGRSLLLNSAAAAQTYMERTADPMGAISKHFNRLIERLAPKKVAIFIDDLDRCQSAYVVELLEGIQTHFRGSSVVFVVAADQDWLNACFQEVYSNIESKVHEPEKLLGARFLEKVFQFSIPLPNVPEEVKAEYWAKLLQNKPQQSQEEIDAARKKANSLILKTQTEGGMLNTVYNQTGESVGFQHTLRGQAAMHLTTAPVAKDIEHRLQNYHRLVESNPRNMKRLINTYNANRAIDILSWLDLDPHQLTLWTILLMRWPRLAHCLSKQPGLLERIATQKVADLPAEMTALFKPEDLPAILLVLNGELKPGKPSNALQKATLEKCARLYA